MGQALPITSVDQDDSVGIDMCDVHRRALHFRICESHLDVDVVDALQKITEITACCFYHTSIAKTNSRECCQ